MLDVLISALSKIVDLIAKRADLRKSQLGPMALYEVYLSLRGIRRNAMRIVSAMDFALEREEYPPPIAQEIERQKEELQRFARCMGRLEFRIEIFDRDLMWDLWRTAGMKYQLVKDYYAMFCEVREARLVLRQWDLTEDFARFDFLRHMDDPSPPDPDEELQKLPTSKYDLTRQDHVTELRRQARTSIDALDRAIIKLGEFIKENCQFNDLFPRGMLK